MATRFAKQLNADRRPFTPAGVLEGELNRGNVPGAPGAPVAPAAVAHARRPMSEPERAGNEIDRLYASLAAVTPESHPRTARLLGSGTRKVAQKVIEEAGEVALAAVKHNSRGIVRESADLIYQLAVLWHRAGIDPTEIWAEMGHRAATLGIAEKLPKSTS